MGPADQAVAKDGAADHGMAQLTAAFGIANQDAVGGIAMLALIDIAFFQLRDQVEEQLLGFPESFREGANAAAFDTIALDRHIAQGIEEILLKQDPFIANE